MKEQQLRLNISSPERELFDGEVKLVTLPGSVGAFTVLPNHAPIVSSLKAGTVLYELPDGNLHRVDIRGGFMEMSNGVVSVCLT